ncbi:hypothetical protein BHE74_00012437 [Ensete ventricosum]|nr:hypothetical protein BHE74_00012437 [Ensete ventricosum]
MMSQIGIYRSYLIDLSGTINLAYRGLIHLLYVLQVIYEKQRKERTELLKRLLEKGIDLDPIPVLNQVNKLMKKPKFNANVDIRVLTLLYYGVTKMIFFRSHLLINYTGTHLFFLSQNRHLGEKSRLEVLTDAGHALQMEKPHEVNYLIEQFIKGVTVINLF